MTMMDADRAKMLNGWALAAGRDLQSKQTGYLHYYHGLDEKPFDTIPILENTLFALSLLRTRTIEHVQEAKVLLNGLLAFQNLSEGRSKGNFPVYLHEYPACCDPAASIHLLAPFYWILCRFGHVIGADLKRKLEQAASHALAYCISEHCSKPFPYSLAVQLASARYAFGKMWALPEMENEAIEILEQLAMDQLDGWMSTFHLGGMMIGLTMAYPTLTGTIWEPLWNFLDETWHTETGTYIGPNIKDRQLREEPEANLYDLFGGYFAGIFSSRASIIRPFHLYGALFEPFQAKFREKSSSWIVEGSFKGQKWKAVAGVAAAHVLFEKSSRSHISFDQIFTPFRLIWGNLQHVHTFICQGGSYEKVHFTEEERSVHLYFDLLDDPLETDPKKKHEIEFFVDYHPGVRLILDGQRSTTFQLGKEIKIEMEDRSISLMFDLVQGEGDFLGHIMRANRPSQINLKGEKRFQSYDWAIFLRTIRRQPGCRIRAIITF